MDPDNLFKIINNLTDRFSGVFGGPKVYAPGLRHNDKEKRFRSNHGRPYTKPPLRSKSVKAKAKTRRKMAQASRRINRGR